MITKFSALFQPEPVWRRLFTFAMATVFITAGVMKLADPSAFTQDILQYRILSEFWSILAAASLPWLEIMAGIALFLRPLRLSASFIILGLMSIFTLAVASALTRGLDITCGCFGKAFQEYAGSGLNFLLRDVILLAASYALFLCMLRKDFTSVCSTCDI